MKYFNFCIATFTYILLLTIVYIVHVKFFTINVVFYSAIADGIIVAVLLSLVFYIPYFTIFNTFEKSLMLMLFICIGYIHAITVPTIIDRSLSVYILEKINQRGGGILQNRFQEVFTQEYVNEHRLVDVRLTEQLESGTIKIENGCVMLTSKGQLIVSISSFYRQNLLPKKRLLMGEYTDSLTEPFRNSSISKTGYECQ